MAQGEPIRFGSCRAMVVRGTLYQAAEWLTLGRDAPVASSLGSTQGSAGTNILPGLEMPGSHHEMPGSSPGMTD